MNNVVSFEELKGLTVEEAKHDVFMTYDRESVITDNTYSQVKKSAIFRTDAGENQDERRLLGLVPENRVIVPYADITDWITGELDKTGVNYKILNSSLTSNCNMYQRYVIDMDIQNPDGFHLAPTITVEGSYTGIPVSIQMGTYRFICSNGAAVGDHIFDRVIIPARKLRDFGKTTVEEPLRKGFDRIVAIGERYQELANDDWISYFFRILKEPTVDVEFKKSVIRYLSDSGSLSVTTDRTLKNRDFLSVELDKNDVLVDSEPVMLLTDDNKSGWNLYNDCTYLSSHETSTLAIRKRVDNMISQIFAA